jgi:Holliday junction resolvase RusA-like endonuclease
LIVLHLPMPPSVNRALRSGVSKSGKPFVFRSRETQRFRAEADALYMMQKRSIGRVDGPFTYHLVLNRSLRHGNADGDNRMKAALDTAQRFGLIENDKLAEGGSWSWGECEHGAMLSIHPVTVASASNSTAGETDDARRQPDQIYNGPY